MTRWTLILVALAVLAFLAITAVRPYDMTGDAARCGPVGFYRLAVVRYEAEGDALVVAERLGGPGRFVLWTLGRWDPCAA